MIVVVSPVMRRACTILLTCALLTAMMQPLVGQACCSQAQCCNSEFCPMKAKARPAEKLAEQDAAQPAENEMQCHQDAKASAPSSSKPDGNCAMKASCSQTELPSILPSLPRGIMTSPAALPLPQSDCGALFSFLPTAFPGFHSPPLHPPRA